MQGAASAFKNFAVSEGYTARQANLLLKRQENFGSMKAMTM